jgi:hypothetical protein
MAVAKGVQSSPELEDTLSQKRKRHGKSKSSAGLSSTPNTDNLPNPCSDPYDADAEDSVSHQTAGFGNLRLIKVSGLHLQEQIGATP